MANKKFSEFVLKTSTSDVSHIVGYNGAENVQITSTNFVTTGGTGVFLPLAGGLMVGNTTHNDNVKSIYGTGTDLSIFHDGSNSYIQESGTGNLYLKATSLILSNSAGSNYLIGNSGGSVNMYYNGSQKLGTTNTGISVTGGGVFTGALAFGGATNYGTSGQVLTSNGNAVPTWQTSGGGGASNLNGLSDCKVDTSSLYVGTIPSGLSNNPQNNTTLGIDAGKDLTTGNTNILVGSIAGQNITTGVSNVVVGYEAANNLTIGQDNVCVGRSTFRNTTVGYNNTAIGHDALRGGGNKNWNTAVGWGSGVAVTTGQQNTLLGSQAGQTITTGSNNAVVGYNAQASSVTATNEITLGSSSISALRCAVQSITSLSDERDKSEIKDLEYGLDFISSLKPREFVWANRAEIVTSIDEEGNKVEEEFYSDNKGKKDFGFIAQEVQEVDNDTLRLVYDNNPDRIEMSYGKLVPVLVKAIQELKAEIELLKK